VVACGDMWDLGLNGLEGVCDVYALSHVPCGLLLPAVAFKLEVLTPLCGSSGVVGVVRIVSL
jgi:hypothetical protein